MNLSPLLRQRFFDVNGLPLAGGQLFTYAAGTTTPQTTYSNETGTANANPIVLDAYGYCDCWIDPTLSYKFVLEDVNNNVQWTVDNVNTTQLFPTWSTNIVYAQGAVVQDSSGYGLLYVSLTGSNQGNALTDVSAWRVFMGNVRTVSSNTAMAITDDFVRSNSTSGNLTMTLPACSTTPIGKEITIKDVGTGGYATTLKGNGSDLVDGANTYASTLAQYAGITVKNNGTSWDVAYVIPNGSITQAKLAARTTGTTVAAGGVAVAGSSGGSGGGSTGTPTLITNQTVTITTTGRPVMLFLQPDGSSNPAVLNVLSSTQIFGILTLKRGSTVIAVSEFLSTAYYLADLLAGINIPPGCFSFLDQPAAGTYTYTLLASVSGTGAMSVEWCSLVAYEI